MSQVRERGRAVSPGLSIRSFTQPRAQRPRLGEPTMTPWIPVWDSLEVPLAQDGKVCPPTAHPLAALHGGHPPTHTPNTSQEQGVAASPTGRGCGHRKQTLSLFIKNRFLHSPPGKMACWDRPWRQLGFQSWAGRCHKVPRPR